MATSVIPRAHLLVHVIIQCFFVFRIRVHAVRYDSTFIAEVLETPPSALYHGGLLKNGELSEGLYGWETFGEAKVEHVMSENGNGFITASNRKKSHHGFKQKVHLKANNYYCFSAWLKVMNRRTADVSAILRTKTRKVTLSVGLARSDGWSMMKGGMFSKKSGWAYLYFRTDDAEVEFAADSISLQRFSVRAWEAQQHSNIRKFRESKIRLQVVGEEGEPIPNAAVSLHQIRSEFPFGCAINQNILNNDKYASWFTDRFSKRYTVFENELKWPATEPIQNQENYTTADLLVKFANKYKMTIRGHNIFWDKPAMQSNWVRNLGPSELRAAAKKRINSVVTKYKNKFIHWDVMNENIHYNFFETNLNDPNASAKFYPMAYSIDPYTTPFLNEYNTIECPGCSDATPQMYLGKIKEIRDQGYYGNLGIGLQGHFNCSDKEPNLPDVRAKLEKFASSSISSGLEIWITELDVEAKKPTLQAQYLAQILNELHSHPYVQGIILWSAWSPKGQCYKMCLTDDNFNNLETGDVVDDFIRSITHGYNRQTTTDVNGFYEASLPYGDYKIVIQRDYGLGKKIRKKIRVRKSTKSRIHHVTIRD